MKTRIAILASGSGTTAETLIEACANNELDAQVVMVISNNQQAGVFERVERLNAQYDSAIACRYISSKNFPAAHDETHLPGQQTIAEETEILRVLTEANIQFVALLGYMKLVGSSIVQQFGWDNTHQSPFSARMVNTHPGILPDTKGFYGIHLQQHVIAEHAPAGHCLFAVDAEYDGGPVVFEHRVERRDSDTPEVLFDRVKASELATIASDIGSFITQHIHLQEDRT